MSKIIKLDRQLVCFSGKDAEKLLHDTLTSNVRALQEGKAQWFALLSPQGKVMFEGMLFKSEDKIYADLDTRLVDDFFKRMRLYKMRADVEMSQLGDSICVGWSAEQHEDAVTDLRPGMGFRYYNPKEVCGDWGDETADYKKTRIENGVLACPEDFEPNSLFAHDMGMDLIGAIDFKKGCYIGQEVVSRMHHRNSARKRVMIAEAELPISTTGNIDMDEKKVGDLLMVQDSKGLALVRIDKAKKGVTFSIAGGPITLAAPEWASYDLSDS